MRVHGCAAKVAAAYATHAAAVTAPSEVELGSVCHGNEANGRAMDAAPTRTGRPWNPHGSGSGSVRVVAAPFAVATAAVALRSCEARAAHVVRRVSLAGRGPAACGGEGEGGGGVDQKKSSSADRLYAASWPATSLYTALLAAAEEDTLAKATVSRSGLPTRRPSTRAYVA